MALPIIQTPIYTIKIPSTQKEIKIRPFLVKEEKALLLAQQSADINIMVDTLREIVSSCVKEPIDVDALAIFDLEFIFTQLRSKSVGEYVDLLFYCDTCDDEKAKSQQQIDISKIEVHGVKDHTLKVDLHNGLGIMMKYPNISTLIALESLRNGNIEAIFDVVADCIDYVYNDDEVFHAKEHTKQEMTDFLNSLTQQQFKKLENFFDTMPKLKHSVTFKCPVCEKDNNRTLEGVESFF